MASTLSARSGGAVLGRGAPVPRGTALAAAPRQGVPCRAHRSAQPQCAAGLSTAWQPLPRRPHQQQHQPRAARLRRRAGAGAPPPAPGGAEAPGAAEEGDELSEEERLSQDFDYLGNKIKEVTGKLDGELKGCSIYLIGMMGSGKTTVGRMIANTLRYAFFDTDTIIEKSHDGKSVSEIFSEHGEEYFRKCETQVLKELAPYKNFVVSTGGGAVTLPANWSYMHNGVVAWLEGEAPLLARRVVAEGVEKRPLLYGDGVAPDQAYDVALSKLSALGEAREKFYVNADVRVPLRGYGADEECGAPAAVVMYRLLCLVLERIEATKAEREAKRNFKIEGLGAPPVAAGGAEE